MWQLQTWNYGPRGIWGEDHPLTTLLSVRVAGHQFEGIGEDRRCACGKTWYWVRTATEAAIDAETEFAHSGRLNRAEYEEIQAEIERDETWMTAIKESSGS